MKKIFLCSILFASMASLPSCKKCQSCTVTQIDNRTGQKWVFDVTGGVVKCDRKGRREQKATCESFAAKSNGTITQTCDCKIVE